MDSNLLNSYREHINPHYPGYLEKLGLCHPAASAQGAFITDASGKTYIDCVAGYGLFNIGHNHPAVVQSLQRLLGSCQPYSRPLITEVSVKLAEELARVCPGDLSCSFMCNSGSEAVDSAIKLARLHTGRKQIIAAHNSFHGYTFGALSVTGIPSFRKLFEPLVPKVDFVPFNDIPALENAVNEDTAAVLLEPVQHEAGISVAEPGYIYRAAELCEACGALLILDEVKTGFGKTGEMFACSSSGYTPDILVLGKSLGGGLVPAGALVTRSSLWRRFGLSFPMSASSNAWNSLACCAALETIRVIEEEDVLAACQVAGRIIRKGLEETASHFSDLIVETPGIGLLNGIRLKRPDLAMTLVKRMIAHGIIAMPAYGDHSFIMIEPPINIGEDVSLRILESIRSACAEITDGERETEY